MKAILVIDLMPKTCKECKYYDDFFCHIEKCCPEDDLGEDGKAIWCPLKPMPNKREVNMTKQNEYEVAVNEGWNACLDEILGETE